MFDHLTPYEAFAAVLCCYFAVVFLVLSFMPADVGKRGDSE